MIERDNDFVVALVGARTARATSRTGEYLSYHVEAESDTAALVAAFAYAAAAVAGRIKVRATEFATALEET